MIRSEVQGHSLFLLLVLLAGCSKAPTPISPPSTIEADALSHGNNLYAVDESGTLRYCQGADPPIQSSWQSLTLFHPVDLSGQANGQAFKVALTRVANDLFIFYFDSSGSYLCETSLPKPVGWTVRRINSLGRRYVSDPQLTELNGQLCLIGLVNTAEGAMGNFELRFGALHSTGSIATFSGKVLITINDENRSRLRPKVAESGGLAYVSYNGGLDGNGQYICQVLRVQGGNIEVVGASYIGPGGQNVRCSNLTEFNSRLNIMLIDNDLKQMNAGDLWRTGSFVYMPGQPITYRQLRRQSSYISEWPKILVTASSANHAYGFVTAADPKQGSYAQAKLRVFQLDR